MTEEPISLEDKLERAKDELVSSDDEYYDFCEKYVKEDGIQNSLFNQKYNSPGLQWIFIDPLTKRKTRPLTIDLLDAIDTRIINGSHIAFFIHGDTNEGKSEMAISIAKYYQKAFKKYQNIDITIHLTFSDSDLDKVFPNLKRGDIVIRDESSIVTGEGSQILQTRINNLIRVIRAHQNSFIYVNPDVVKVPLVNYYLETAGKNYKERKTRLILYDKEQFPIGRLYLSLHSDQEFRDRYEKLKDENIEKLKLTSGLVPLSIDNKKLTRQAEVLMNLCIEENTDTKIGMKDLLLEYNDQFDETERDQQIGGTEQYNKLLFERTSRYLKKLKVGNYSKETKDTGQEEKEVFEKFKQFIYPYSYEDIIEKTKEEAKARKKFRNTDRNFEIYLKIQNEVLYDDILPEYPELNDKSAITRIKERVEGFLNEFAGKLFESKYSKFLQTLYKDKVIHEGGPGEPDAYVIVEELQELHIFSIKYLKSGDSIPSKELNPELEFAWKNRFEYKKVKLFLIVFDYSAQELRIRQIKDFSVTTNIRVS